jgi:hypothetical protein
LNIEQELLKGHSAAQSQKIASFASEDPKRFAQLLEIQNAGNYRINQRASSATALCVKQNASLLTPHIKDLLKLLRTAPSTTQRNILRLLQYCRIPSELMGEASEICFDLVVSKKQPIAVKVFSMTVLYNIAREEPGLANELKIVIEDQIEYSSAGFRSRGSKILKGLKMIIPGT